MTTWEWENAGQRKKELGKPNFADCDFNDQAKEHMFEYTKVNLLVLHIQFSSLAAELENCKSKISSFLILLSF